MLTIERPSLARHIRSRTCRTSIAILLAMSVSTVCAADEDAATRRQVEFFEQKIRPVLVARCYECHSTASEEPGGNLLLDSRDAMRSGGESGSAIVPFDEEASLLLDAIRYKSFEMPPDKKLPDAIIADFEQWIEAGAIDPREQPEVAGRQAPRGDEDHWSFQSINQPDVPSVKNSSWPTSDIDRFVLARMREHDLTPVGDADKVTLIRRAYLDLVGLLPTREEVEAFLGDDSVDAFVTVVDRLLQSDEFGVRWGRHWLDVVRYAESTGFERNFTYPHAWRYRDYVVDALNADMPYDRFITEQVAGDLLPYDSEEQMQQQSLATGMLAFGPKNLLGSRTQFHLDLADDQINVTSRAFLGLTVACARCHDHKFDPIRTEDYYALAGIFMSTEALYGTNPGSGTGNNRFPSDLLPLGTDAAKRHSGYRERKSKIDKLTLELGKAQNRLKKIRDQKKNLNDAKSESELSAEADVERQTRELKEFKRNTPARPDYAMAVREAKKPTDTAVRISGVASKQGKTVPRGFPAILAHAAPSSINANQSGRLELAEWLTSPANPLTARVMANRVWHHLFGRGIVATVDNFGFTGTRPSHPKLLDHLALRLRDGGWSLKSLIREVMLSRVYQLSSQSTADRLERDGENIYRWRMSPRRLDAEVIRDCMLQATGKLRHGPPEFGSIVAQLGDGCLVRQVKTDSLAKNIPYRSLYLPAARHFAPDIYQAFDGPSASLVVGRRSVTNVPAQSLFLLNNPLVSEQSRLMADRLRGADSDAETIERAWWLALARPPTSTELENAQRFVRNNNDSNDDKEVNPGTDKSREDDRNVTRWIALCQAFFVSGEFRTSY